MSLSSISKDPLSLIYQHLDPKSKCALLATSRGIFKQVTNFLPQQRSILEQKSLSSLVSRDFSSPVALGSVFSKRNIAAKFPNHLVVEVSHSSTSRSLYVFKRWDPNSSVVSVSIGVNKVLGIAFNHFFLQDAETGLVSYFKLDENLLSDDDFKKLVYSAKPFKIEEDGRDGDEQVLKIAALTQSILMLTSYNRILIYDKDLKTRIQSINILKDEDGNNVTQPGYNIANVFHAQSIMCCIIAKSLGQTIFSRTPHFFNLQGEPALPEGPMPDSPNQKPDSSNQKFLHSINESVPSEAYSAQFSYSKEKQKIIPRKPQDGFLKMDSNGELFICYGTKKMSTYKPCQGSKLLVNWGYKVKDNQQIFVNNSENFHFGKKWIVFPLFHFNQSLQRPFKPGFCVLEANSGNLVRFQGTITTDYQTWLDEDMDTIIYNESETLFMLHIPSGTLFSLPFKGKVQYAFLSKRIQGISLELISATFPDSGSVFNTQKAKVEYITITSQSPKRKTLVRQGCESVRNLFLRIRVIVTKSLSRFANCLRSLSSKLFWRCFQNLRVSKLDPNEALEGHGHQSSHNKRNAHPT